MTKICIQCGRSFEAKLATTKLCSKACSANTGLINRSKRGIDRYPAMVGDAICKQCGKNFPLQATNQIYCGESCRRAAKTVPKIVQRQGICAATVGAVAELRVCADLLAKGFHVFRAVSPACPCDLVAISKKGSLIRIEVRTAHERSGRLHYSKPDAEKSDLLALVTAEQIIYKSPASLALAQMSQDDPEARSDSF